jgi:caffeoyl-CoA O-methyltransferase
MRRVEIVNPGIEDYLTQILPEEGPLLAQMESHAAESDFPIVGPLVGRILYQLVRLVGARRILELGSGFGYSGYWFGRALGQSGEIHLTEFSQENLELARDFFARGGMSCRVHYHQGDGLEILKDLDGQFDIIFNDVDKQRYPEVLTKAGPRVRSGGLLVSDNVLWHGRVAESHPDETTQSVLEHNRLIFENPDFFSSIIPIRDGVAVCLKR